MAIGRAPLSPLRPPIDGAAHNIIQEEQLKTEHKYNCSLQTICDCWRTKLPLLLVARLEAIELTDPLLIDIDECWEWPSDDVARLRDWLLNP